nr:diguanylate cyclase [Sutcliffiella horikoshii]
MLLSFSIIVTATIGLVFQNLILVNVGYDKGTLTLIIGISILSVSSIILINNFIIKGISWRIAGLVNHINNIKKGDFGTTTPIKQKDEIGDLHKSINELSISLLELKEKEKELNFHRSYDPVTGLPNRSHLYEKLIHLKAENKTNFIIMLDIHGFKILNDIYGEKAGDEILTIVGRKIEKISAPNFVARVSSDEFSVVTKNIKREQEIHTLVRKIKDSLAKPIYVKGEEMRIDMAVGVSKCLEEDFEGSLTQATLAMIEAKKKGRGQVEFYLPSMTEAQTEQMKVEKRLFHAVNNQEIYLEYQPKVSLISGQVIGVEALARWNDPFLGKVPPNRFIPIAEETGMITALSKIFC